GGGRCPSGEPRVEGPHDGSSRAPAPLCRNGTTRRFARMVNRQEPCIFTQILARDARSGEEVRPTLQPFGSKWVWRPLPGAFGLQQNVPQQRALTGSPLRCARDRRV